MLRSLKIIGGLLLIVVTIVGALYAYQTVMLRSGRTPEGFHLLTSMPEAQGFEPTSLPTEPVLKNRGTKDIAIAFGYKVGKIPFSYTLQLTFPSGADAGHASMTVRRGAGDAKDETDAVRRWDAPRKAFAVALQEKFDIQPPVPSLCIKAVIGPKLDGFDLHDASICVAQRDASGICKPETLACGLIR